MWKYMVGLGIWTYYLRLRNRVRLFDLVLIWTVLRGVWAALRAQK